MFSYFYFPVNREVAQVSDVVFTMVGYPKDVEEVILGSEGVLHGLKPGSIVIDMTTSRPSLGFSVSFILTQWSIQHTERNVFFVFIEIEFWMKQKRSLIKQNKEDVTLLMLLFLEVLFLLSNWWFFWMFIYLHLRFQVLIPTVKTGVPNNSWF